MNVRPKHLLTVLALGLIVIGIPAAVCGSAAQAARDAPRDVGRNEPLPPRAKPVTKSSLPPVVEVKDFIDLGRVDGAGLSQETAEKQALRKAREDKVLAYLHEHNFLHEPALKDLEKHQFTTVVPALRLTDKSLAVLAERNVPEVVLKKLGTVRDQVFEPLLKPENEPRDTLASELQEVLARDEFSQYGPLILGQAEQLRIWPDSQGNWHCVMQVQVSRPLYLELVKADQGAQAAERQFGALKVFGVLLALVLAVGGYFYLDEATKGYYRVLLRLGALSLVVAVSAVIWFVLS